MRNINLDAGFVNGQTIVDSNDRGIVLEGQSSGRFQSFEKYQAGDRPLDIAAFEVCVDEKNKAVSVLVCPGKQAPVDHVRSEKTGKTLVHFGASVCRECKVNTRCPVKIGTGVATLTIDDASYAGAASHHQYMENADYRYFFFLFRQIFVPRIENRFLLAFKDQNYYSRLFSYCRGYSTESFIKRNEKTRYDRNTCIGRTC